MTDSYTLTDLVWAAVAGSLGGAGLVAAATIAVRKAARVVEQEARAALGEVRRANENSAAAHLEAQAAVAKVAAANAALAEHRRVTVLASDDADMQALVDEALDGRAEARRSHPSGTTLRAVPPVRPDLRAVRGRADAGQPYDQEVDERAEAILRREFPRGFRGA